MPSHVKGIELLEFARSEEAEATSTFKCGDCRGVVSYGAMDQELMCPYCRQSLALKADVQVGRARRHLIPPWLEHGRTGGSLVRGGWLRLPGWEPPRAGRGGCAAVLGALLLIAGLILAAVTPSPAVSAGVFNRR